MKVIFACGGTGGHINPALAVARVMKERNPNTKILFAGTPTGMEARLVTQAGFDFTPIKTGGFQRKLSLKGIKDNIRTLYRLLGASRRAKQIVRDFSPDIVIGTGGYVSGPVVRAAAKLGVHTLIHEQNAFPGVTTKLLSKYVDMVLLASPSACDRLGTDVKTAVVGNPVREQIMFCKHDTSRKKLNLPENKPVILSFGGSLGAKQINLAMAQVMKNMQGEACFVHATGSYGYKWMPDMLLESGVDISAPENCRVLEYIDDMPDYLAACDLVICRSGAITLGELEVQGKPGILIPSPNVAENHQYYNAMELVNAGAADIIEEKNLSGDILTEKIRAIIGDSDKLKKMKIAAQSMAMPDAADKICNWAVKIADKKSK